MSEKPNQPAIPENEQTARIIEGALLNLWAVVNDLSLIKIPNPRHYRVTIFGSARMQPGGDIYAQVKRLATRLSQMGCEIVTGGGPGLMQAANEGASAGDPENLRESIGVRVELPFEQHANPFVEKAYLHRTFFSRLHHFVRLSSAFVVVEGGIGTLLEAAMIWQLLQVRQIHDVPLIFLGPMWRDLVAWARAHMLKYEPPLARASDLDIPICLDTVDQAVDFLQEHIARTRPTAP